MQQKFNTIAVVGKYQDTQLRDQLVMLIEFLRTSNRQVLVERETAQYGNLADYPVIGFDEIGRQVDLVIVLGGDGTMLAVARALLDAQTPVLGINRGRIGFLTDIAAENMLPELGKILAGECQIEQRLMLQASVLRDGKEIYTGYALNDVVISKGEAARLIDLQVAIDGEFLHRQRSDGLIVATPTGTTAYALSAGGPILHPTLEAISLVPICPHTLSNRPITINSASQVCITLVDKEVSRIHFDGQSKLVMQQGDEVRVKRAQKSLPLMHPANYCYFETLRNKLSWS